MLLKEHFSKLKSLTFGPLLSRFISTFSNEQLESTYQEVNPEYLKKNGITIIAKANIISNQALKVFKEFILSDNREINYSHCRSLKKVENIDGLIQKFSPERNPAVKQSIPVENIEKAAKSLIQHIDQNSCIYYAIAKNLEESNEKKLPSEVIIKIINYLNGDIDGFNKDSEVVSFSGAEGVAQKLIDNSEQ